MGKYKKGIIRDVDVDLSFLDDVPTPIVTDEELDTITGVIHLSDTPRDARFAEYLRAEWRLHENMKWWHQFNYLMSNMAEKASELEVTEAELYSAFVRWFLVEHPGALVKFADTLRDMGFGDFTGPKVTADQLADAHRGGEALRQSRIPLPESRIRRPTRSEKQKGGPRFEFPKKPIGA